MDSKEEEHTDCGSNLASTNGMGRLERFSINGDRKTDCWRCDWSWRQDNQPLRTVLSVVRSLARPLRTSPGSCRHYLCFSSAQREQCTACQGGSMQASQRPAMSAKWMMQDLVNESLNWGEEPQKVLSFLTLVKLFNVLKFQFPRLPFLQHHLLRTFPLRCK